LLITNLVFAQNQTSKSELSVSFLQDCYEEDPRVKNHFDTDTEFWNEYFKEFAFYYISICIRWYW